MNSNIYMMYFLFQHQTEWTQFYTAAREDMNINICLPKYGAIFLFLAVFVLIFSLRNMDVLKVRTGFWLELFERGTLFGLTSGFCFQMQWNVLFKLLHINVI